MSINRNLQKLIGKRYYTGHGKAVNRERELRSIEMDLEDIFGCYVKCAYDPIWSHRHKEEKRRMDYIINYELYETKEDRDDKFKGGMDGEVHELYYLKGNGNYIVITEV